MVCGKSSLFWIPGVFEQDWVKESGDVEMKHQSIHKILATLGPCSLNGEVIAGMEEAGVSLFRINLSHTRIEDLEDVIKTIRSFTEVPICIDSEGAQIRTRKLVGGKINLEEGARLNIRFDGEDGDSGNLSFYPGDIASKFLPGDEIDIDFYGARLQVEKTSDQSATAIVIRGGNIGENKAVSVNRQIELPYVTKKDIAAIAVGRQMGVGHFALSFTNTETDVQEFRSRIGGSAFLISKVESVRGLRNLMGIADEADAILIDRGDLSREVPIEQIPFIQRRIIASVKSRGKPVYVATNLLESMIEWHAPNRAEVNDVVSTLEMGASGLVLAAETAIGNHPLEAVRTVRRLIDHFSHWTPNTNFEELLRMETD
jgi:pyruvate kinase